ncbi:MAG: signal peptide peptidase SppA [Trichloromonadaceae bacterium]
MKKRPFLMALLVLGAIFVFFLVLLAVLSHFQGGDKFALGDKVAIIAVEGMIVSGGKTIERLHAAADDASVKAVVLRIDSPGGGVGPSQEIHDEVVKLVQSKPVVVSMGSLCASGGYYIAAPASRIFANPGTITGSIGVIMEFTNIQDLLDKIGLKNRVVKSGKHKDIGSPVRPMSAEDEAILQGLIDDVHSQFVEAVAAGRKLEVATVKPLADGRIFTGRQAQTSGLVDELGNLESAIAAAAELGGIAGKPKLIYPLPDKKGFWQDMVGEIALQVRKGLEGSTSSGLQFVWSDAK